MNVDEDELLDRVRGLVAGLMPPGTVVGPDTGLREHGLESLAVTRLWFLLRKEFGVDIPVPWLGAGPTVAALADRVRAEQRPGQPTAEPATPPATDRFAAFPLTDLQQAYLIGRDPQLTGDPVGCHIYREFTVDGLDADRLCTAWRRVVDAHDMLRMVVTPDGRQRIQQQAPQFAVPVHDAAGTAAEFAARVAAVRDRLAHRRYEAGSWPMHTVEVSRGPGGRGVVHVSIDALLTDGHGLAVILDDWWRCYADPEHRIDQPELTVRDCVVGLAAPDGSRERHLDYWADRLAGMPPGPDLVGPEPGARPDGYRRSALTGSLDREQWRVLRGIAVDWGVSPTALVLTLFAEAFGWQRVRRPFSVVLTTNHRARLADEADTVVGPFTSSIVVPLPDTLDRPLRAAATAVHEQLWQDLDHAAVSSVAALRAARAKDRTVAAADLPVVFTSLLGTGRSADAGFAGSVSYALSQTAGVALDRPSAPGTPSKPARWFCWILSGNSPALNTPSPFLSYRLIKESKSGGGTRRSGSPPVNHSPM